MSLSQSDPRLALVETVLARFPDHLVAVQTALDTLLDMLRQREQQRLGEPRPQVDSLCGLQDLVPALYLRLGREQEALAFVRTRATELTPSDHEASGEEMPRPAGYLHTASVVKHGTLDSHTIVDDEGLVGGGLSWLLDKPASLSCLLTVMLLKIRINTALVQLQNAQRALDCCLPQEVIDLVRAELIDGPGSIVAARRDLITGDIARVGEMISETKKSIHVLYTVIHTANKYFWPALLNSEEASERLTTHSPDSEQEARRISGYFHRVWRQTPRALEITRILHSTSIKI